jgi:hypothetical protein
MFSARSIICAMDRSQGLGSVAFWVVTPGLSDQFLPAIPAQSITLATR